MLSATMSYNRATGIMSMTYDYQDYFTYCKSILKPVEIGYNAAADASNLHINFDVSSLTLARSVNKGSAVVVIC